MICQACRERHHDDCRGGSWCDCQHLRPQETSDEPPINWVRQG